jgi:hypothetical protein
LCAMQGVRCALPATDCGTGLLRCVGGAYPTTYPVAAEPSSGLPTRPWAV